MEFMNDFSERTIAVPSSNSGPLIILRFFTFLTAVPI